MNLPTFQFYNNPKSEILDVILQGNNVGVDSPFLQKVFNTCKHLGNTTIVFNFPYYDRGEDLSSGEEVPEELKTLQNMLDFVEYQTYRKVRLIGKSFGSIVSGKYVNTLSKEDQKLFEIVVLGYVTESVTLKNFDSKITIIQGEMDKFGNIETVKKDLEAAVSKEIAYYEIPLADHSYRNPETKEPIYEDEVIDILKNL